MRVIKAEEKSPKVYYVSCRLDSSDETYHKRREKLLETIDVLSEDKEKWVSSTSFIVFRSLYDIDTIAGCIKGVINKKLDIVVVGKFGQEKLRIVGALDDKVIFELVPKTRHV